MDEYDKNYTARGHEIDHDASIDNNHTYDQRLSTRNVCLIGLTLSWIVGVACIILAFTYPNSTIIPRIILLEGNQVLIPEVVSLLVILVVTLLNESMGLIHSVTLRWALYRECRLDYNSNLRLFTSARSSPANKWYSNLFLTICVILSYSSPSQLLFYQNDPASKGETTSDGVRVNEVAFNWFATLVLGLSLLGQAAITTWAWKSTKIPTWSSSPLDNLRAVQSFGAHERRPGRSLLSIDQQHLPAMPTHPRARQCSAWTARREVRHAMYMILIALILAVLFVGTIFGLFNTYFRKDASGDPNDWHLLPSDDYGSSGSPWIDLSWWYSSLAFAILFAISAIQAVPTLALHCCELIVNLSRDEAIFRRMSSARGLDTATYNSITAAFWSWETMILFFFKNLIHWAFGLSIGVVGGADILLHPNQMVFVLIFFIALILVVVFLALRRPSGTQPATYGHLQTMADVIDQHVDGHMWWGEIMADAPDNAFALAGTADHWLPAVDLQRVYY